MKPMKVETESASAKTKQEVPPPPPPLPTGRIWVRKTVTESITKQEIARFWMQKRVVEEDHLLAAIKAAARIRARNISEEDYKQFVESLKDDDGNEACKKNSSSIPSSKQDEIVNEVRVGIKDWWTKSKYAYLNQPAIESMEPPRKRTSTYIPSCFTYKPVPVYPSSLGVF
ncbi:uncharacterized protein LOC123199372 [Mangifera indica]|uniref:uncharacterized protein LOC123199372 n=1 Tax=Mangifera indica TaxID=29780 RepID=UPI001CFBC34B|nr:uncharacterized protein LOC123199372 [Mangifera indica]